MIAPMKKASLVFEKDNKDAMLYALQKCGEMMFFDPYVPANSTDNPDNSVELMNKAEMLIKQLKRYAKKEIFSSLPEISKEEFDNFNLSDTAIIDDVQSIFSQIAQLESSVNSDKNLVNQISKWSELTIPLEMLSDSIYTSTKIGSIPISYEKELSEAFSQKDILIETIKQTKTHSYFVLSYLKDDSDYVDEQLVSVNFVNQDFPPLKGTVAENISSLSSRISENDKLIAAKKSHLVDFCSDYTKKLSIIYEKHHANISLYSVPFSENQDTISVQGWIRADRTSNLEKALDKVTSSYALSFEDPSSEELPPTATKNNRFVTIFEGITNMFSHPSFREIDPNPFMAPWYWLIFGMIMGDVGYGVLMAVIILILKKLMKPTGGTLQLMNVILISSIPTIIFGVLFGSYFGELWHPFTISPNEDPVGMLIFTLIVGMLHIFTGFIAEIIDNIRHKHFLDAIFDQFSWMLILSGIGMMFLPITKNVGIILAIIGAVIVFLTAGRRSKNIFGKIAGGLAGLYGISGYFSNILSYSRILALSLSSAVIGMVVNLLAGLVSGSAIGFVFAIFIYIFGHSINLALGLLSAYVHDCRLQYIEFYGKFYQGGGIPFKPFALNPHYIQLK